jgi:hypothetical protein
MIQRIQSVWFLLAALLSALLMMDWYTGYVYKADVPSGIGSVVSYLRVTNHFPSLLLAVAMIILPLITIFFFKDRKRQRSLGLLSVLLAIAFIAVSLMRIENFKNTSPMPKDGSYQAGMVIPAIVIVFLMFAISGIRKDDKLVKSMDRLR